MKFIKITVKTKVLSEEKRREIEIAEEEFKYNAQNGNHFMNEEADEVIISEDDYETVWEQGRVELSEIESYYKDPNSSHTNLFLKSGNTFVTEEPLEYFDKYFELA